MAMMMMMTVLMTWVNISFQDQCLFTQRTAKNCIIGSIFGQGNMTGGKTNNEQPALGHAIAINGNRKPMPDETPSSVCGRRRCTHTHVAGPKVHSQKLGVLGEIYYFLFT